MSANNGAIELNRESPLFDNIFPITIGIIILFIYYLIIILIIILIYVVSGANNDRTVPLAVRIIPGK